MRHSVWLGTAAALVMMSGAAGAADLTVAEPVDYVKVCDAFGAGFFYSPGTDTCIKIGGYVKFGTNANNSTYGAIYPFSAGVGPDETHWGSFYTEASIQVTASSVTEYGNLTGWIDLRASTGSSYDYAASGGSSGHIDSAYLELGGLKAGHFTSAFDSLGGYTDFGAFRADQSTDHIQYSFAMGNFGLTASVEDGSDRYSSALGHTGSFFFIPWTDAYDSTKSVAPDLVAAATFASGPVSAKLSGAYVNAGSASYLGTDFTNPPGPFNTYATNYYEQNSGWAVQASVEIALDQFGKGDKFGIQGVYAEDAPAYTGWQKYFGADTVYWDGTIYGGFLSYLHYWNPSLWSAAEFSYLKHTDGLYGDANLWQVSASTDWAIVKNLDLMLDGSYAKADYSGPFKEDDHQWSVNVWLKRSW